jgi:phospholipase C
MTGTLDPEGLNGGPIVENVAPDGGYRWTTYAERLERAGVTWKVYQQVDNYGCNMLELFERFQQAPKTSRLYERGMERGAEGRFEHDAVNDKLPTISWIIPTGFQSEHPDFMPADGAAFVASKIDAIAANPEVWAKTAFVLNYDENDGIFDHVGPVVPDAGTPHEFVGGVPIGSGFRVPCIIVSPWTAGGWVCSERFDHTSVLRLMESITGVAETNVSEWRRRTFGDLTSAFRFGERPADPPALPDTAAPLNQIRRTLAGMPKPVLPAADQRVPVQETGRRRRVPREEKGPFS